ncbi:MAG: hypothetical protein IT444_07725 [Phycisphaeraceae bacterium]|nr:hypothetical protein [Phycisphaeraceae bacterium]
MSHEVVIWTDTARAPLAQRIVDRMGMSVRVIGLGGSRSAEVAALGRTFDSPTQDDFRKLIIDRPAAFVLLMTMEGLSREDLSAATTQGATVLTIEPPLAGLEMLGPVRGSEILPDTSRSTGGTAGSVALLPAFVRSSGWISAADPHEHVGTAQLVSFTSLGLPNECSLFARLYDAWRTILHFTALPETVDATLVSVLSASPDNPRAATGHLALHARLAGTAAALIEVSDNGVIPRRNLHVLADKGRLEIGDSSYSLSSLDGQTVDHATSEKTPDFAELVADSWQRFISRPDLAATDGAGSLPIHTLACCLATLLSARTRQPESPQKILALQRFR